MDWMPPDFDPSAWVYNSDLKIVARCHKSLPGSVASAGGLRTGRFRLRLLRPALPSWSVEIGAALAPSRLLALEGRVEWLRRFEDGERRPVIVLDAANLKTYLEWAPGLARVDGCPHWLRAA